MGLHLHRAERTDRLADALGELLRQPPLDPFRAEVVGVPTRGIERWLAQRLSHHLGTSPGRGDGVCAQVEFPSLGRLLRRLDRAAAGGGDDWQDPWDPRRAVWPLLSVLDATRSEAWAEVVWRYLVDSRRRFGFAEHLARLFSSYGRNRPDMIAAWLRGGDVDAADRPLPPDRAWQPELWRRLHAEIGEPSPAERLSRLPAALASPGRSLGLPDRVSVFGVTRLDEAQVRQLDALAETCEVHLWLPHPSPALWDAVAARLANAPPRSRRRAEDPSTDVVTSPLLAYLGREGRELQVLLNGATAPATSHHYPAPDPPALPLLPRLQRAIAGNDPGPPLDARPLLDPTDCSLQIHAAHGPDRQVEVLREVLVGLLADDDSLEPRDVVVMCSDIETYAPLVAAAFGLDPGRPESEVVPDGVDSHGVGVHPGHRLRVRLADRSLRSLNPLLATLSRLLDLADSRVEASALLDLCLSAPVARKFGFGEDDTARIPELVARSGIRWGLDAAHRRAFGLSGFGQNTWAAGMDRMLLGVAMDEDGQHYIGTALPLDDVDSSDVDLVGRLTECVDRIRTTLDTLSTRHSVGGWMTACTEALTSLCLAAPGESWQTGHAYAELHGLAEAAGGEASAELSLAEVRALLADAFQGRASRANFRTGTLTMCTMLPMRSVPHRVVCLLGLDDGVFPRRTSVDGDDIAALDPHVGDRDPRSEDRQLFLDAICAAQEKLVIVYAGADPRTGTSKPPAVPLGELLDVIDASVQTRDGRPARAQVTVRHPLQPFSPRNFSGEAGTASFDPSALRGARASLRPRQPAPQVFGHQGLPPAAVSEVVNLAELGRFYAHPVKALLRTRGGLSVIETEEADDEVPVELDGLESWSIGDRLLRLHLQGAELEQLARAEWRRGSLPPRAFGQQRIRPILDQVRELAEAARPHLAGTPDSRDVLVELGARAVAGTVSGLREDRLVAVSYSRLAPKHRLHAWIELLALAAGHPGTAWRAVTVGRGGTSTLGPVAQPVAREQLGQLVDTYLAGLSEPLPFSPKASGEYARIRYEGKAVQTLTAVIEQKWAEDRDPAYERFFGPGAPLAALTAEPVRLQEATSSLPAPTRFGALALRIFEPLLAAEVLT